LKKISVTIDVNATDRNVDNLTSKLKTMKNTLFSVKGAIASVGAAYATIRGASQLAEMADEAAKAADEIGKTAEKYSLSTEALSKWEYAAGFADVSTSKLHAGLGALTRRLNNFQRDGSGAAKKAFEELGITQEFARTQMDTTEKAMNVLLQKLDEMPDGIQKTAIAQDLFSKSASDVVRMANLGADALQAYGDEAQRAGIAINEHFAQVSAAYNDAQARLDQVQQGYTNVAVAESGWLEFSTAVYNDAANLVINYTEELQKDSNSWVHSLKSFLEAAYAVFPNVWEVMKSVGTAAFTLGESLWTLGSTVVSALIPPFQGFNQESDNSISLTAHLTGLMQGVSMAMENFATMVQMASVGIQMFSATITGYALSAIAALQQKAYQAAAALAELANTVSFGKIGGNYKELAAKATSFGNKSSIAMLQAKIKVGDLSKEFSSLGKNIHSLDEIDAKMKAVAISTNYAQKTAKGILDLKMPEKPKNKESIWGTPLKKDIDLLKTLTKEHNKAAKAATKTFNEQERWNERFTNDFNQATLTQQEYAIRSLDKQRDEYIAHNQDKLQVATWYNAELAKINEQYAEKEKKTQESVWKNYGKSLEKNAKAKADFLSGGIGNSGGGCVGGNCGKQGAYITPQQSQKYAEQAGKSFGSSFQDSIVGKEAEKSYESMGSKFGNVFGQAIRGALSDYINGEGDITLREASRKQFDDNIGGAIRTEYPMLSLAADIYSAMNTETRNDFQQMDVNIDADNTGIADSLSMLDSTVNNELPYFQKMTRSLENMESQFGAVAVAISTSVGFDYTGANFDLNQSTSHDIFKDGELISYDAGGIKGGLSGFVDGFLDSLFGTTTKTLEKSGIGFGKQSAEDFMNGIVDGYQYQDIKIKKSSVFGLVKSTGYQTVKEDLDSDIEQKFADAIRTGYEVVSDSMESLGVNERDISDLQFDEVKLDFKDKSQDEINDLVTGAMTARLDDLTLAMFGGELKEYQSTGEDYTETILRISTGYQDAKYSLDRLGIATVNYTEVANKSAKDFGGEVAKSSIVLKEHDSGIGKYIETLEASTDAVVTAYTELHNLQTALQKTSSFAEFDAKMIEGAGSREALISGQSSLLENFYTLQEQNSIKQAQMNEELSTMGLILPATKDEWRELLESVTDPELYGRLISMSSDVEDAFKSMEDASADVVEQIMKQIEVQEDLLEAQKELDDLKNSMQEEYNDILEDTAKTLRDLARSSNSVKDSIYTTGLDDDESIHYYLDQLNSKEQEFASFFDSNGALLPDKYDEMQSVYAEINSISSSLTNSLEDYDRSDYLKENIYDLLSVNQAIVDSNAKVMEVQIAGGTLDGVLGGLSINEFSTLVGLSEEQKAQLITVASQTVGLAQEATLTTRYAGQAISVDQSNFVAPYSTVGVSNMIPSVETGLMKDNTFEAAPTTVSVGNITAAQTDVSTLMKDGTFVAPYDTVTANNPYFAGMAKDNTVNSLYKGADIAITNPALLGSVKLSDLLGSSSSGLTGILNLTDEQKQKIAALEAKAAEESSAQTYYNKASTYFDAVLADIARKAEADTRNLSAASFGATSTLGTQEDIDFQTVLGNAGLTFDATQRANLYDEMKGFATQTDDLSYLKTLLGYNDATGTVSNIDELTAIKALQPYLPNDATSAYGNLKSINDSIKNEISTHLNSVNRAVEGEYDFGNGLEFFTGTQNSNYNQQLDAVADYLGVNIWYRDDGDGYYYRYLDGHADFTNIQSILQQKLNDLPQFKSGGFTGYGNPNDIAGITHKQEFVVPHKGALVLNKTGENKELKEIKEVLKETKKELEIMRSLLFKANQLQTKTRKVEIVEEEYIA